MFCDFSLSIFLLFNGVPGFYGFVPRSFIISFYFRFFTYCLKNEQECHLEFLNLIIHYCEFFERLQRI